MLQLKRSKDNPIFLPDPKNEWEKDGAFNGCVIQDKEKIHLVYRAFSPPEPYGLNTRISSIGYAQSTDGIHFGEHRLLIKPEVEWEIFGCEDPRVSYFNGDYFIFYTALSTYPFAPEGIKIGLAITSDFQKIKEKHPVTVFNSKAMALFPKLIDGKIATVLTVDTDIPPAKIAVAFFDSVEQIWSPDYWKRWHSSLNSFVIPLLRSLDDQVEVGAPPVKTKDGWLLVYSYIKNYFKPTRTFGIEAVLLDLTNPQKIIARTEDAILTPEKEYETSGNVPNVVFPSGALVKDNKLLVYYGAADTTCCLAQCPLTDLLEEMKANGKKIGKLQRFKENPIITPIPELAWQSKATFNPGAIYEGGKTHLIYRAMSQDNTSVLGYAASYDGFHVSERLASPIYVPTEIFEKKAKPYANSGCEDPRITKIGERIYMLYTAFDGLNPYGVALTSISVDDFLSHLWNWEKPKLISPPQVGDKNACLFPRKIQGKYVFLHRPEPSIWIDIIDNLNLGEGKWLGGKILLNPRKDKWDNLKVGAAAPPIETQKGWLLLYHGVSDPGQKYKVGAVLLDLNDPTKVIARTDEPIFEPEVQYEIEGHVPDVTFPCGAVVLEGNLLVYYGGADRVVGVAYTELETFLRQLLEEESFK